MCFRKNRQSGICCHSAGQSDRGYCSDADVMGTEDWKARLSACTYFRDNANGELVETNAVDRVITLKSAEAHLNKYHK
jgi:hypothetical protein